MTRIIITLVLVATLAISSCSMQNEMLKMPIGSLDLSEIRDGTYPGYYENYRWHCEVEVAVLSSRIDTIEVLRSANGGKKFYRELISRVVEEQSLQVDAVSGGTITSITYLKAVENALQKESD